VQRRRSIGRTRREHGAELVQSGPDRERAVPTFRKARSTPTHKAGLQHLAMRCREVDANSAVLQFTKLGTARDRRRSLRKRVRLEVELDGNHTRPAYTRDVSAGGLFVVTDHLRAVGSRVTLTLKLPTGHQRVVAKVCWLRALPSAGGSGQRSRGLGLKILALSTKGTRAFAHLLGTAISAPERC
jgi:Tfp pilus assembly protein PilZ